MSAVDQNTLNANTLDEKEEEKEPKTYQSPLRLLESTHYFEDF